MKRKIIFKLISLFVAGVLIVGIGVSAKINAKGALETENVQENVKNEKESIPTDTKVEQEKNGKNEKNETVFVKADAQGKVIEIEVSEWLKIADESKSIKDVSILKDIVNVEGDEEYTEKLNDVIYWENHGANISYEGTTDKELPVSVKVSYFLDGQNISPKDLAGKSGEVRIRFEYENHTNEVIEVNGREVESVVPFLMCTMLYLPSDVFYNVEVVNGQIMESEGQTLVVGMAFPGLSDTLCLTGYEPTEEIEIPEYFEITADVVDFELEFTATAAITGLLEDFDIEELDELEDMIDDMKELEDATGELSDGVGELLDGVKEVRDYVNEYISYVGAMDEGVGELLDGMGKLTQQNELLTSGAATLKAGIEKLDAAVPAFSQVAEEALNGVSSQIEGVSGSITVLSEDAAKLNTELDTLSDSLNSMSELGVNAENYKNQVTEKLAAVQTKVDAIDTNAVNEAARNQAKEAVAQSLAESGLDEATIQSIQANADAKIDSMDFTGELGMQVGEVKNELTVVPELEITQNTVSTDNVNGLINHMKEQLPVFESAENKLMDAQTNIWALKKTLAELKTQTGMLVIGSSKLDEGITAYTGMVSKVYEGVGALKEGTGQLASVGGEFNEGFDEMIDGIQSLKDGVDEFNEEGIGSLTDLAGEELRNVINGIKGAKIRSDEYNNYAGIVEGMEGSVMFIIETEGIEK